MNCRICDNPIGMRADWGHTGCATCEALALKAQIAAGILNGKMPDWYISEDDVALIDGHYTQRQASDGVREGLASYVEPDLIYPEGFYGKDHPEPDFTAHDQAFEQMEIE